MTDAELRDAAVAHLKKTTVDYKTWADNVKKGKYRPKDGSDTEWGLALAALTAIGAVTPPPPPPGFTLTSSLAGGSLAGPVEWAITSSVPLAKVEFFIDGTLKSTEFSTPYIYGGDTQRLDPATLSNGTHALKAVGAAVDGRTAEISFSVTVANTPPPPPVPGPDGRIDLSTKSSTLAGMLTWLKSNPQPALIPAGLYQPSGVLDFPPGCDLLFTGSGNVIPQSPGQQSFRFRGASAKVHFEAGWRIGKRGAPPLPKRQYSNAEAAAFLFGGDGEYGSGARLHCDGITIEGAGNNAMFFYRRVHDVVVSGKMHSINSAADDYHITDSAYDIDIQAELISEGAGDDCFAVVSYKSNWRPCQNIRWRNITGRNQRIGGRGVSVVGGKNVTVDKFDLDGTTGASVYIAAEPAPYYTFGVDGVKMTGKARNPNTEGIHAGSVEIYNAQAGETIQNVDITIDADPDWPVWRRDGSQPVSNVKVNGQAVT